MPPKKSRRKDRGDNAAPGAAPTLPVEEAPVNVRRLHEVRGSDFGSTELFVRFGRHVRDAQDAYLRGDNATAENEATAALAIKPTPSIFALLSVVAESKGQFDRANDFRLLQAFLAHDAALWEELLHEFLSQQLYYKSVVCLQRMSALEQDPARYRTLQFQLADLLIGLGEIRRATHVLVPLWNSSKCRDFEVFALLSSLYFQLGKWSSLQRLITSSLRNSFHIHLPQALEDPKVFAANEAETARGKVVGEEGAKKTKVKRVDKRVRFFGVGDDDGEEAERKGDAKEDGQGGATLATSAPASTKPSEDDFSFDALEEAQKRRAGLMNGGSTGTGVVAGGASMVASPSSAETGTAEAAVRELYGDRVTLSTPAQKRNFLTLVNVHAELLNESGKFAETAQLMVFTASALQVELLDLPPDLLVRLGTAYAFLGGRENEQPCREIFEYLVNTCSMEEYGDVLLDAALSLAKVGIHSDAHRIFEAFARHYQLGYAQNVRQLAAAKAEVATVEKAATAAPHKGRQADASASLSVAASERLQAARQRLSELQAEHEEMKTVMSAAYGGAASSLFSLRRIEEAERAARMALEADPTHLQARLLLGKIYFYHKRDVRAAVDVLTPQEGEPALQRIQLGASLVRVFFKSHRYVEAIALGVSLFEVILAGAEDGDTESVAPGSSRRTSAPLLMPTMSRASSAIIPASTLVQSAAAGPVRRLSASLAASIRTGTSVYRQQFTRRGRAALTTTVYGASAAASVAAGWGREDEEAQTKDSTTIFRFHRKRARRAVASGEAPEKGLSGDAQEREAEGTAARLAAEGEGSEPAADVAEELAHRRQERRDAVTHMDAESFWESPEDGNEGKGTAGQEGEEEGSSTGGPSAEAENASGRSANETGVEPAACDDHGSRKRARREAGGGMGNATTMHDKDRSLEELEAFEKAMEARSVAERGQGEVSEESPVESFELPSLEEISKRFNDPAMAQLFLEASSHEARTDDSSPLTAVQQHTLGAGGAAAGVAAGSGAPLTADRVTLREAITALGRMEFMNLTVTVVDAYSAIGRFTEAKEFAFIALRRIGGRRYFHQMGTALERPLRLALLRAAMAAGHGEDAFRVGLRLLQDDQSAEERTEVIELMHGVLNRCEDRTAILYRVFTDGACDVPLLVLLANRYYQTRSYTRVLNLYLCALQERPSDIFLNFVVGLCYLLVSHQKAVKPREALVSAGVYYLSQYQSLLIAVDPSRTGEALYNSARAMDFLKLHYLCVPLYERVARDLAVPERCSLAIQRAARVNLYYIYAWESGNKPRALAALPHVMEGSRGGGVSVAPSTTR